MAGRPASATGGAAVPYLAGRLDIGYRSYPDCPGIDRPPSEIIRRLYLDTVLLHEPAERRAIETVGADHLVFGSDYPHVTGDVPGAIATVEHMVGDAAGAVLGDTAARLFGLTG